MMSACSVHLFTPPHHHVHLYSGLPTHRTPLPECAYAPTKMHHFLTSVMYQTITLAGLVRGICGSSSCMIYSSLTHLHECHCGGGSLFVQICHHWYSFRPAITEGAHVHSDRAPQSGQVAVASCLYPAAREPNSSLLQAGCLRDIDHLRLSDWTRQQSDR